MYVHMRVQEYVVCSTRNATRPRRGPYVRACTHARMHASADLVANQSSALDEQVVDYASAVRVKLLQRQVFVIE